MDLSGLPAPHPTRRLRAERGGRERDRGVPRGNPRQGACLWRLVLEKSTERLDGAARCPPRSETIDFDGASLWVPVAEYRPCLAPFMANLPA
jgi:hypothetical protein